MNHTHQQERAHLAATPICYQMAVDSVLADVDTFTDWLYAECMGKQATSDHETRAPGRLIGASPATLLHAALVASQRGDVTTAFEAMRELSDQYLRKECERIGDKFAANLEQAA